MAQAVADLSMERPLSGGFYTASEVSRILRLRGPSIVNSWLGAGGQGRPTIVRQYEDSADVGFWDLIEIRFVNYFRGQGVSLQHIRKVAAIARERLQTKHPFALSNVKFKTDRKEVFLEVSQAEGSKELEALMTGQLSFYEVVEDFLAKGIEFDVSSGLAKAWQPEPKKYPNVSLNPRRAHGQPSVGEKAFPTGVLFQNWRAEAFSTAAVADWFEVDEDLVRESVEYELELDA